MIMIAMATKLFTMFLVLFFVTASPAPTRVSLLELREELQKCTTEPYFPDDPKSCGICQQVRSPLLYTVLSSHAVSQSYGDIDGCVDAAPVLANFSMVYLDWDVLPHPLITSSRSSSTQVHSWTSSAVHARTRSSLSSLNARIGMSNILCLVAQACRCSSPVPLASSRRTRVTC